MKATQARALSALPLLLWLVAGSAGPARGDESTTSPHAFFAQLSQLCGSTFEGEMSFPPDPDHDFAGKLLVAEVAECSAGEIRIPFAVGEDRSRTWILTLGPGPDDGERLLLKHDHRHADGTPDEITMYGGWSTGGGALAQSFAADQATQEMIPAAATNVWTISLAADGGSLTYSLERHAKPRFEATLQRRPPAP